MKIRISIIGLGTLAAAREALTNSPAYRNPAHAGVRAFWQSQLQIGTTLVIDGSEIHNVSFLTGGAQ